MSPFIDDVLLDSREPVEDHGATTAFDVVKGCLGYRNTNGEGDCPSGDGTEGVGHDTVLEFVLLG